MYLGYKLIFLAAAHKFDKTPGSPRREFSKREAAPRETISTRGQLVSVDSIHSVRWGIIQRNMLPSTQTKSLTGVIRLS